jgi:HK97 family phage major capsid protein
LSKKKKKLNTKQDEESLEERMNDVSDAFRAEHETKDIFIWVAQTFEDHVIIEESGSMFKVGFVEEDGDFIFDGRSEWVEVEKKVEFIEKSARAFIKQTGINALKSLSKTEENLVVGNYIVLFGDEKTRDLEDEWFTKNTQLESSYTQTGTLYVDWEHGHGKEIYGVGPDKDDVMGIVNWDTMKMDDMGIWVERVLDLRNKYMAFIEPLIEEKLIGTSSLSVAGGAKVKKSGEIEIWPLKRDTLTVIPAEPRMMSDNAIASLKSLVEAFPQLKANLPSGSGDDPDATAKPEEKPPDKTKSLEVIKMNKEELLEFFAEKSNLKVEDLTEKQKYTAWAGTEFEIEMPVTLDDRFSSLQKSLDEKFGKIDEVLKFMQDAPALEKAGYMSNMGGKADPNAYSFGDFLLAVVRKDAVRLEKIYKSVWLPGEDEEDGEKADMSHLTGSTGGFLIPPEFENRLLQMSIEMSPLTQMVTVLPVASNRGSLPVLDQSTAPTAGQGDVAWTATVTAGVGPENTALSETNPLFAQVNWNIHKVGGITQAPNELVEDAPLSIELILSALFATTINSRREFLILNGTGAGEARGILQSGALIAVTTIGNNVFALGDALAMLSRFKPWLSPGIWVAHPGVIPDIGILQVGSSQGTWMKDPKTDVVIGQPLLGKPIIYSEHLPQDDNSGDVLLIDPKAYLLFQKRGMKIDFSEHVAFKEDQGTWRFTDRMDGQPWVSGAVTLADPNGSFTVSPYVKHHD